jgi:carboxymethylenebutenolidase
MPAFFFIFAGARALVEDPFFEGRDLLRDDGGQRIVDLGLIAAGGIVNMMAVRFPDLAAAVPFYGVQPSAADTVKIRAPLLIHYAGLDERIDSGWPAWKEALDRHHVRYQEYTYPNVNHGFHNDTTPRYDEQAAKLAWSRTLAFFDEHLKRG